MKLVAFDCLLVILLIALISNINAYVYFPPANEICFPINGTAPFEKYYCDDSTALETNFEGSICATDGITYKNECEFNRAKCQNPQCQEEDHNCIKKKCKGKCPCQEGCDSYNFDSIFCDYYENAFCGSDNITYRSNCEFSTAKCESLGLYGVELTVQCNHVCPCRKECDNIIADYSYSYNRNVDDSEKLCGTDGFTYDSIQELKHSACTDYHDENFTIDCLGPCPCNSRNCLEDLEFNLKNTVEKTNVLEGTYTLASEMVNERPYWTLVDENLALWYDGNNWIINNETQIGSTQGFFVNNVDKADCPTMGTWKSYLGPGNYMSYDVEVKTIDCPDTCPSFIYNPVCGSDGETYSNDCELRMKQCKRQNSEDLYKIDDRACGDWSETVYCEDSEACQEKFGNTTSTQCLKLSWNLEKRICAPLKCLDNDDCPGVSKPSSDPCWTREQQGRCNRETYECDYESSSSSNIC